MKKIKKEVNNKIKNRVKRILTFLLSFVVIYLILASSIVPKRYDFVAGDIATSNIKATRDIIDEDATKQKKDEALEKVEDIYTVKVEVENEARNDIEEFFTELISISNSSDSEIQKINKIKALKDLSEDQCKTLLNESKTTLKTAKEELTLIFTDIYSKKIQDGDEDNLNQAKELAVSEIGELSFDTKFIEVLKLIFIENIKPNLFYDEESTLKQRKDIEDSVESVVIKKNQLIVNEGEPITESQIKLLKSLGVIGGDSTGMIIIYITLGVFIIIVSYLQYWFIKRNFKDIYYDSKKIILINIISIFSILLARGISIASPYLIPLVCSPLLMTILLNYKLSIFVNSMNLFFISVLVEFEPQIVLVALICNLLGSAAIKKMQQRNDIMYAAIFIAVITAIMNFSIGIFVSSNIREIMINSLFTVIGVITSGVLAIGLLPLLESIFDVVTTLKLLELSNPNNPLLKKLLMEAPGTYHHCMLVANLAEMAADEVGANSVITRIGAYYHDIGKISRPYFFKENQLTKENPHDSINGNLSTMIIVSHVKDGVEMAEEYNLPQIVIDIIKQHHGTTLVKYFYYKVKNSAENSEDIKEEDFKYPGPIPSTKESGIIMLADSTEAAVRSISEPTTEKIEEMINNIVDDKLKTGQLNNCELTIRDLNKIKESFLKALNGIYHKRIEYPTEKKEN